MKKVVVAVVDKEEIQSTGQMIVYLEKVEEFEEVA